MIKIGLFGACNNSKIYANLLKQNSNVTLIGIFDEDLTQSKVISKFYNCIACASYQILLDISDAIIFVGPVDEQFEYAKQTLKAQKHLLLRRPFCKKITEAKELIKFGEEAAVKIAIGQTDRFNQAFIEVQNKINNPLFIETHRCTGLQNNTKDINVVTDLMVHDIDLILSLVKSNVKKVFANGVAVVNKKNDIVNARVEFENGCIANLTANRIALKPAQKMTIFQKDAYFNINLLRRSAQTIHLIKSTNGSQESAYTVESGSPTEKKYLYNNINNPIEINALQQELSLFIKSILQNIDPPVSIFDAYDALDLAHQIIKKIKNNSIVAL